MRLSHQPKSRLAFKKQKHRNTPSGLPTLVICVVFSMALIQLYSFEKEQGPLHSFKSSVNSFASPLVRFGSFVSSPLGGLGNIARNATADEATLKQLEEQNVQLRRAVEQLEEYKQESERLSSLLDISSTYKLNAKAARVIGASQNAWSRTIVIDKGSADGLTQGLPVMNSYGLIGQIEELSAHSAQVRLISDENSGVSAMIQSNRAVGVIRGSADGSLRLEYITVDAKVEKGDVVITSGLGGTYPKGLPIGEVVHVSRDSASLHYNITVRPPRSSASYEEVLVVTKLNDPTDQPISGVQNEEDAEVQGAQGESQAGGTQGAAANATEASEGTTAVSQGAQDTEGSSVSKE